MIMLLNYQYKRIYKCSIYYMKKGVNMVFSIEEVSEQITNKQVKEYFQEVISSYIIGNYRSAIVMLYSVVIVDLIYKMKELQENYNDKVAERIISEIERMQKSNETSPAWEKKLVELVKEETNLLSNIDKNRIERLREDRNLAAHPVISSNYKLIQPSREKVRDHIRDMLEGVLIKPALFSKKVIDVFLDDTARMKSFFLDKSDFYRYIDAKYLNNMNSEVKNELFASLWKLTFRLENDECNANRTINLNTIVYLYLKDRPHFEKYVKDYPKKFSDISEGVPLDYLFQFLCIASQIYKNLPDNTKSIIEAKAKRKECPSYISAWFITGDIKGHISNLEEVFQSEPLNISNYQSAFNYLYDAADLLGIEYDVIQFYIKLFEKSNSWNEATNRYNVLIKPYINKFRHEETEMFINAIESNSQIYDSFDFWNAKESFQKKCEEFYTAEEIQQHYPNLSKYL